MPAYIGIGWLPISIVHLARRITQMVCKDDMINDLPVFRRVVKAIGEHENPQATAYRYELVEYRPDGRFIVKPAVPIAETQLRADGDRLYEAQEGFGWRLLSADEFLMFKLAWDALRADLGYACEL